MRLANDSLIIASGGFVVVLVVAMFIMWYIDALRSVLEARTAAHRSLARDWPANGDRMSLALRQAEALLAEPHPIRNRFAHERGPGSRVRYVQPRQKSVRAPNDHDEL